MLWQRLCLLDGGRDYLCFNSHSYSEESIFFLDAIFQINHTLPEYICTVYVISTITIMMVKMNEH